MSIEAFIKGLADHSVGPGATWHKADFHVHAPKSSDYEYRGGDAVERLGQALREGGYSFAIILKHQEFPTRDELAALQPHCPNTTLIPGAEVNVFVDALSKKVNKDYFFHCIVAVDPNRGGDYGFVLQKAKERFSYKHGDYPAGFHSSILDLGRFFRTNGALFIPAHLHQSKKPEVSRSIDDLYDDEAFLGFVSDGAFDALEVRQASTAAFFAGGQKTAEGLPIPEAVCVASSDAHHHEHVRDRNRFTWIRAERPSFAELELLRSACDSIGEQRGRVVALRETLVAELNRELPGVRLAVLRSADHGARTRFQERHGPDGVQLVGFLQGFGRPESYQNLRALFDRLSSVERDQTKWDVSTILWDVRLIELLDVWDDDDVEIALHVGKAGFVPIQNLSAGQRSVAVFPLLLRNSKGPLVIDQPEDNLDNRYIADIIAPDLLGRKRGQQYLVTSHNANLVVLTDADLVVHVEADGTQASFAGAGFLSCSSSEVRDSVLSVLDGGEAALAARQRKYGASLPASAS